MKRIHLTILSIALIFLLATPQVSYAKVPLNLKEDDEFTFEMSSLSVSEKINGTEYADQPQYDEGTEIKVVVNNIDDVDDSSTSSFFGASNTYVNFTETIDDEDTASSSYVDSWQGIFLIFILVGAFSLGFSNYPDSYDFTAPDSDASSDDVTGETGFPYFATSNTTFYKELEQSYEDLDDDINDDQTSASVDARLSDNEESFSVEYTLTFANSTENTAGDDASFNLAYTFEVDIDLTRSVITHFLLDFSIDVAIGDGSSTLSYVIGIDEVGGGILDNLPFDVPGPSFLVALFAVLSLGILPRLRRRE